MPYVTPEQIERAKQMDLLTYLQYYEPQELVRFSGNVYTTRTHDSLKISNREMVLVVAQHRRALCPGLSHQGEGHDAPGSGASDRRTGGCHAACFAKATETR